MRFNDTVNTNQGFTTLRREWTKLYNFIRGGNDSLNGLRRDYVYSNFTGSTSTRCRDFMFSKG